MLNNDLEYYRQMARDMDVDAWAVLPELCDEIECLRKEVERLQYDEDIDELIDDVEQKRANLKKNSKYVASDQAGDEYVQAMMKAIPILIATIRRMRGGETHV